MEYHILDDKVKSFHGNRVRLSFLLFGCSILIMALNFLPSFLVIMVRSYSLLMIASVAMILLLPVFQNSIYAIFLCAIRNEKFTKADCRYSFSKLAYHVGIYLAIVFLQAGIKALLSYLPFPIINSILANILDVAIIALSVFSAFAIFQGVKGVYAIIVGSLHLMEKHWKNVVYFALPYLIWTLLMQLAYNLWMSDWFGSNAQNIEEITNMILNSSAKMMFVFCFIGLNLIQYLGMAIFQYKMFLSYGILFDQDYQDEFPVIEKRKVTGKIIDIRRK